MEQEHRRYTQEDLDLERRLQRIDDELAEVKRDTQEIKKRLENAYVSRIEFDLRVGRLEKIVYGLVATVLVSVVGAIMALVLRS